jgi:iron complex outermembrane recepter protein
MRLTRNNPAANRFCDLFAWGLNLKSHERVAGAGLAVLIGLAASTPGLANDAGDQLATGEAIVVTGRRDEGDLGATKSAAKLLDEPQSVTQLDAVVIQDQLAITQDQLLRNVPAITRQANQGNVGGSQNTSIRGFSTRTIYKDGARYTTIGEVYLYNVATVEVLKGPAGMLYGSTPPGGVIAYSRKKPQPEWAGNAYVSVGSDNFINPVIDLTGPLSADGALSFRAVGSYVNDGQFIDFNDAEAVFLSPSLRYRKDGLTVDLVYEYGRREETFIFGLPFDFMVPRQTLPRDRFLGHPNNFKRTKDEALAAIVAYEVDPDSTVRLLLNETRFTHTSKALRPFGVPPIGRTYDANGSLRPPTPTVDRSAELNFTTSFDVAGMRNTLLAGADYRRSRAYSPKCNGNLANLFRASVDAPDYTRVDPLTFNCATPGFVFFDESITVLKEAGAFVQNDLWLTDRLKLLAGLRYGEIRYDLRNLTRNSRTRQTNDAVTTRLGLLYKPLENLSFYASYAESFQQLIGQSADNRPFLPTRGTQYEGGAKLELFGGKGSVTAAIYEITQRNLTLPDPDNPGFSIQEGQVRSRGGEIEVNGMFGPRLQLTGGFGFIDNEVIGGANSGRRLPNVYRTKASLFANYALIDTDRLSWKAGGGVFHHGNSFVNAANNRAIPKATVVDLATSVAVPMNEGQLNVQLNVRNLFNELDFTGGFGNGAGAIIFPEPGRQFVLTVGYAF